MKEEIYFVPFEIAGGVYMWKVFVAAKSQRSVCTNCGHIGPYPAPPTCPMCNGTAMRLEDVEDDGSLQIKKTQPPADNPFYAKDRKF